MIPAGVSLNRVVSLVSKFSWFRVLARVAALANKVLRNPSKSYVAVIANRRHTTVLVKPYVRHALGPSLCDTHCRTIPARRLRRRIRIKVHAGR